MDDYYYQLGYCDIYDPKDKNVSPNEFSEKIMAVIGPQYSEQRVDRAYEDIMNLLRDVYKIQNYETFGLFKEKNAADRVERNKNLKEAIRLLFELDSWESF